MTTKNYENRIKRLLQDYFNRLGCKFSVETTTQWPAFSRDKRYSPRVDVAVGPFATDRRLTHEYDQLCQMAKPILDMIFKKFEENIRTFNPRTQYINDDSYVNFNRNARCFMAIEVERTGSRKHRLGDIVNASALGRIGVIVAWDKDVLRSFFRILEYFSFLQDVGKNTFNTRNIVVLEKKQFLEILKNIR